jgi:uncharacterized ferritin-like protein (DUF455 family)
LALPTSLGEAACWVLNTPGAADKVSKTRQFATAWQSGRISEIGDEAPPLRPQRPPKPELRAPTDMPKRRPTGPTGRLALIHAIAHIELNAIDLAWDILVRFIDEDMPRTFYDDWCQVALDEAEHFDLLARRMADLGGVYGDLPAHDGLWEAAISTRGDLLERLAIVPMVLEARGLDTTPGAVKKLRQAGDMETADAFESIANEEIPHVRAGVRWFEYLCGRRKVDPFGTFHDIVANKFSGTPKPPFNIEARDKAGMASEYYRCYQN